MKLTQKNPGAKNKIAEGKLSLTNASRIGAHIEKNKIKKAEEVTALVDMLCGKSTREAEVILFDLMPIGAKRNIKIEISVTTHEKFEQYRKKFGTYTDEEIMQKLLDTALIEKVQTKIEATKTTKIPVAKKSRYIPTSVRQTVLTRATGQCESVLREQGKRIKFS